ncbi:MAG: nitrilase-related carbon-nitrogen hydrolase [Syntrophobacteraceae bacterium]
MIRIAVVQNDPVFGAKQHNVEQCLTMMRGVQADLYVLPELFATGYNFIDEKEARELAEPFPSGYTYQQIHKFASRERCFVVYGFGELANDSVYNSAAVVGHDGSSGLYRKVHLFDREKLFFAPGDLGFQVFETALGRIGVMICFDWYFPESARTLALKGAQIVAHPSNLVLPNCPDCMPTRCLENRVFAATADRVGTEDRGGHSLHFIGKSQITSPRGAILHRASPDRAEIASVEVELSLADDKNLNTNNHLLRDRRPETYV